MYSSEQSSEVFEFPILTNRSRVWPVYTLKDTLKHLLISTAGASGTAITAFFGQNSFHFHICPSTYRISNQVELDRKCCIVLTAVCIRVFFIQFV